MITNYYRPKNLSKALELLENPQAVPLGGGTWLNKNQKENMEVVDLQALGLNKIQRIGNDLEIGACVTLQQILESSHCPDSVQKATSLEAGINIRNTATVAGMLVTCDGRSALATMMLALDAKLAITNRTSSKIVGLGEFLSIRPKKLITKIIFNVNNRSAFTYVSRSPKDKPIVCAAVTHWSTGRTRLTLGGFKNIPVLAMDGTESAGIDAAARSAYYEAGDAWASAEYRSNIAAVLAKRCFESVSKM